MKKYEILEHKADLKIRTWGSTKEELFVNALLAMQDSMKPELSEGKVKRKMFIESSDPSTLLVDFLSELLYLIQINKEIYSYVNFRVFSGNKIEAELIGQKVERFGEDIKAVTYHGLDIYQKAGGTWEATVLFDI
ncbi:MAG: archease [Candidatus Nealsonbacteria bacterium CG_4_10_14_0_2_um_filter_38_17]|uniref:Archease n=2 Tax=Candidatus Nealsoniibacteriota TaxID=1817911 RepID=A0A2M7UX30_9BACT|nr:MAG: archease [Candidatus Nealsonbacteria bacterium CG23_combo_of_CG06-09_8_20_14_all_38_19]PIZ88507.1 MAG: archease [Candidatus Nealsonbacteria bacterium CG_4_10_14_0_2_um_filter_38_17]